MSGKEEMIMLAIFDHLRDVTLFSVALRLFLAVLCGGLIGIERTYKRRPAGFRTHILICMGASVTTLTSQYMVLNLHYYTDMGRLGAQVVAGIGFIGAGTIIVTRQQRVKGLTTAAGMWASAIIGLAFGVGFYEGGIVVTALVMLAEVWLSKMEYRILNNVPEINLYMEYRDQGCLKEVLHLFRFKQIKLLDIVITRAVGNGKMNACAILTLRLNKNCTVDEMLGWLRTAEGVLMVEEL
ncbi:MAG: MgtC/SapB family protein [Ruminococcus sp.]|jgi:putative Mg2+ transporter-C (MgtC) family protein